MEKAQKHISRDFGNLVRHLLCEVFVLAKIPNKVGVHVGKKRFTKWRGYNIPSLTRLLLRDSKHFRVMG